MEEKIDNQQDKREGKGFERTRYHGAIPAVILLIVAGLAFLAGDMTSFRRSSFGNERFTALSRASQPEFDEHLGSSHMMMGRGSKDGGQQTLGSVTKIDGNTLTIIKDGADVTVKVVSDTSIFKNKAIAKQADIKTGDVIIVHGRPGSDGSITAQSIVIN